MTMLRRWRPMALRAGLALLGLCLAAGASALDLNTATRAQIEQLPRIGVARAELILNARAQRPFTSWDDFRQRVPGYGEKSIQHLQGLGVTIEPPASTGSPSASAPR